jgi:hypothetical protein
MVSNYMMCTCSNKAIFFVHRGYSQHTLVEFSMCNLIYIGSLTESCRFFLFFRGVCYPSLWPSHSCKVPLDVSNKFTFKGIDGILSGDKSMLIFPQQWVKIGSDHFLRVAFASMPFTYLFHHLFKKNYARFISVRMKKIQEQDYKLHQFYLLYTADKCTLLLL